MTLHRCMCVYEIVYVCEAHFINELSRQAPLLSSSYCPSR